MLFTESFFRPVLDHIDEKEERGHSDATLQYCHILVPRAAILLASATDRDLWQGPG